MKFSDVVELLSAAAGTCQKVDSESSKGYDCSGGNLGSVSFRNQSQ